MLVLQKMWPQWKRLFMQPKIPQRTVKQTILKSFNHCMFDFIVNNREYLLFISKHTRSMPTASFLLYMHVCLSVYVQSFLTSCPASLSDSCRWSFHTGRRRLDYVFLLGNVRWTQTHRGIVQTAATHTPGTGWRLETLLWGRCPDGHTYSTNILWTCDVTKNLLGIDRNGSPLIKWAFL